MTPTTNMGGEQDLHALIEQADAARGVQGKVRAERGPRFGVLSASPGELVERVRARLFGTEDRARRTKRVALIGGPIVAVGLAVGGYLLFAPMSKPDYERDGIRRVLTFTMLTDEFNKLPVDERMRLLSQLMKRFQSMSSGDSALMAAFAAGIGGKAREQVEQNASRLMIDLWDKYSAQYERLAAEERAAFLDKTIVEFQRLGETMSGRPSTKSDAEVLADAKKQAARDSQALKSGQGAPPARAMGRMFVMMRDNVGGRASPAERARGQVMMRDMVQRLRGGE